MNLIKIKQKEIITIIILIHSKYCPSLEDYELNLLKLQNNICLNLILTCAHSAIPFKYFVLHLL